MWVLNTIQHIVHPTPPRFLALYLLATCVYSFSVKTLLVHLGHWFKTSTGT